MIPNLFFKQYELYEHKKLGLISLKADSRKIKDHW